MTIEKGFDITNIMLYLALFISQKTPLNVAAHSQDRRNLAHHLDPCSHQWPQGRSVYESQHGGYTGVLLCSVPCVKNAEMKNGFRFIGFC